jgi:hypothetical protein
LRGKSEEPRAGRRRGLGGVTAPRSELAHALLKGHDPDSDLECYQLLLRCTNDHEHLNLGRLRLPNAVGPEPSTRLHGKETLSAPFGHFIPVLATSAPSPPRAAVSGFPLFVGVLAPSWHRDADREFPAGWTWRWTQPHSGCTAFRVSEARRAAAPFSRTGRGAGQARRRNGADRMTTQYRHPAPARHAHVPQGRAARTDPRAATAHGRRLLRDLTARRRGDRRRQRATPGAVQRPQPGSVLDELRRVLRRSRRRACTVCCWRSRARRSRDRRSAGAAVVVQEATRMGGTGPLQRSCEATSRRASPATRRSANARTVSSQRRKSRSS